MNSTIGNSNRIGAMISPTDHASPDQQEQQAERVAHPGQPSRDEVPALAEREVAVEGREQRAAAWRRLICIAP